MIHFALLFSRQGKVRLSKYYKPYSQKERAKLVKEQEKAAPAPPPPPRGVSADEIDIVKPTGGGDSFTARIKAAQAAKAGSR